MFARCLICIAMAGFLCGTAFAGEDFDYAKEGVGAIHLGLSDKEVKRILPCKAKKGKDQKWGADGMFHQTWDLSDCGLNLDMASEKRGAAKSVASITANESCKLQTKSGIHIGSDQAEVAKAYGRFKNVEESRDGETFVAGSIFGGLIFQIQNGKVNGMFIGAAAE